MTERRHTRDPAAPIYVGLMSGTSLDGIAAAVVCIPVPPEVHAYPSHVELLAHDTHPYTPEQRSRIERAVHDGATPAEWSALDFDLGHWFADAALATIAAARLTPADIRAIASHGQTVWHDPGRSTWQIGEAAVIAERTRCDVVSDFRVRDVAAGGQGAPLVPMADALLFAPASGWRAMQNIGGIGNVTVVPARTGGADALPSVRAFDTGPGVMIVDAVVRVLFPGQPYDADGRLARAGHALAPVVDALLADPYFAAPPPKSTGRERFGAPYARDLIARCRAADPNVRDVDVVATAVALTARSVADAYGRFVPEPVDEVVVSGGGARNPALIDAMRTTLAPRPVHLFTDLFFDGEAKEAVAFALLGALHIAGLPGNVPKATGASGPRVLGVMTKGG